ncbi:MAG: class I SAM-dependent methyltransferase [Armatimonadetes bacterium]|nr:class I SAM-dependent methyltransferase [Armatimonadota bacterium]
MSQVEYGPLAEYYELINESCVPYDGQAALVCEVLEAFGEGRRQARVLDVACGPGLLSRRLLDCGLDVVGIDLAEPLLTQAAARNRGRLVRGDMRRLPFRARFNAACCLLHSVNYMTRDEDLAAVFEGIALVLEPGGVAVVDFIAYEPRREWEARWSETIRAGPVEIITEHDQTPDWVSMVAVDRHRYTIRDGDRTWTVSGEDHLRITSAGEMCRFAETAGLEPLTVCGKYDLSVGLGSDGGVLVARKAGG